MNGSKILMPLLLPEFLYGRTASYALQAAADALRGPHMHGFKTLICSTALLAVLTLAQGAQAQLVVSVGVQPVCSYGYYDYQPYACAPMGFYGSGYFYNGIFLGMGPWAGWGYGHGWGAHRFVSSGGGSYRGNGGLAAGRAYQAGRASANRGGGSAVHASAAHTNVARSNAVARPSAAHVAPHAAANHSPAVHASTGASHAGAGGQARSGEGAHR